MPVSIKQAESMLTKLVEITSKFSIQLNSVCLSLFKALRLDAGVLVDDYELEVLRSIEKIYPQLAEVVSQTHEKNSFRSSSMISISHSFIIFMHVQKIIILKQTIICIIILINRMDFN